MRPLLALPSPFWAMAVLISAKYEKGTLFLPQLLQAATAAQGAFEEIKTAIAQKEMCIRDSANIDE